MDILLLLLQLIGIAIWLAILAPALILVSKFLFFLVMANNGGQYDPRAQAMEEVNFDWRCIVCCMVALSPLHLEQQHLPGTESVYFDLANTPWDKCDKCHTPFHLCCGTWESLNVVRSRHFFALFFAVGNFRSDVSCHPFLFCLICLFFLKMGRRPSCPDGDKKKKKKKEKKSSETDKDEDKDRSTGKETKTKQNTSPGRESAHRDQSTGNFTADMMIHCINEIKQVEVETAAKGEQPKLSRNMICRKYALAPGTISKRMMGKVKGMGPQGRGARRGRVFDQG